MFQFCCAWCLLVVFELGPNIPPHICFIRVKAGDEYLTSENMSVSVTMLNQKLTDVELTTIEDCDSTYDIEESDLHKDFYEVSSVQYMNIVNKNRIYNRENCVTLKVDGVEGYKGYEHTLSYDDECFGYYDIVLESE